MHYIHTKVTEYIKRYSLKSTGWYRIAKYDPSNTVAYLGTWGNSVEIVIKTSYSYRGNCTIFAILNTSHTKSQFNILGSIGTFVISKLRHVVDKTNNVAYLEIYYDCENLNGVYIELKSCHDFNNKFWEFIDAEPTQETVENVDILSSANLVSNDRKLISSNDFNVVGYQVTTLANTSKEIVGAPTTPNYVPVIVGATQTKGHQTTITFDSGKWYAYSNTSQVLSVRFYKIPISS